MQMIDNVLGIPLDRKIEKLISEIDWSVCVPFARAQPKLPDDGIAIGFNSKHGKESTNINNVTVRLGSDVMEQMEWKAGDKLILLTDNKNRFNFMIVKPNQPTGYCVQKDNPGNHFRVNFTWTYKDQPLSRKECRPVKYHVKDKKLIVLNVDQQDGSSSDLENGYF